VPQGNPAYGVPHPGIYWVDANGLVTARHFEDDYRERFTISGILTTRFGERGSAATVAETEHLKLTASIAPPTAAIGQRVAVELNVELKPGMHVYAPGVHDDYTPVRWEMAESPAWKVHSAEFPRGETMRLAGDTVPVYRGRLRLMRDLTVAPDLKLVRAAAATGEMVIKGSFRYQACDETKCFPPRTLPLEWKLRLADLDRERVPAEMRRMR
jgi:hypothetical protein